MTSFEALVDAARSCRACGADLPHGPRPVFQVSSAARLLIASQAPGRRVHGSGIPFSDPSGDRLREWTGISPTAFYDERVIAILPMGFCYPGRGEGGDAPPRRECADLWRRDLLSGMPELRLTLLVGAYAQADVLGPGGMTERVRRFREYLPRYFPLPHPSWRSRLWAQRNPWFEEDVLPELKTQVRRAIDG
ncbi:MAG TPA: uracil-DNA glycosylase family protein [Allosphingosinicella sp.]